MDTMTCVRLRAEAEKKLLRAHDTIEVARAVLHDTEAKLNDCDNARVFANKLVDKLRAKLAAAPDCGACINKAKARIAELEAENKKMKHKLELIKRLRK